MSIESVHVLEPAAPQQPSSAAPVIPLAEFSQRVQRAQELIRAAGFDALLVNSNEADFANVRYFSDYWTLFETAGVLIPARGEPALLIGPESGAYARDRSRIRKIHKMVEYRESADPAYPGVPVSTFPEAFADIGVPSPQRLGIGGYLVTTAPLVDSLHRGFPGLRIEPADSLMVKLRAVKSDAELACLRRAFEISEQAVAAVLEEIRPGLTERQVVGIAQQVMYQNGAEYEGHPTYILAGRSSSHAISRPTAKVLGAGELVQLNIGARVSGYSSSVGLPVCLGKMDTSMRELVEFGLEAHAHTIRGLRAGVAACDLARRYRQLFIHRGYARNFLYGPCHGLGMMEVEPPWMEETSNYPLAENMTFQVDTFVHSDNFGLRWENGGCVTSAGFELFSGQYRRLIELT